MIGFVLALMILVGIAWLLFRDTRKVTETNDWVAHTHAVIIEIETMRSAVMDAESAQRGYIITGDDNYLEPYTAARSTLDQTAQRLERLTADNPSQQLRADRLQDKVDARMATMAEGIQLRREGGFEAAHQFMAGGLGKKEMNQIRALANEMVSVERDLLNQRTQESRSTTRKTIITFSAGMALSFALLLFVFWLLNHQISVRRRAEAGLMAALEKERILLDSAVDVICTVDAEGRFVSMNPACLQLWGYTQEELIGRQFVEFIVPEDVPRSNEAAAKIEAGESTADFQNRYLHKNGSHVHVMWSASWSKDQQLMFCVARDISERHRAEEKLQKFAVELQRSNAELQDFASVASHDLQEPLRKIQSFADELKGCIGDKVDADELDTLDRMIAAAARMRTLINDLLSFSRVTSMAKPFSPVDLSLMVKEVLSDLEARLRDTGGRVEVGHLPWIDADPMQMLQLLQNLIGNGLKFHRAGVAPVIRISGENGGPNYRLAIADNGIGFDEKYLDRIFTVFQRLHGRKEYEGTGIGLAICRKIVERHGGEITARSAPGEGATFIITLPIKQSKEDKQ